MSLISYRKLRWERMKEEPPPGVTDYLLSVCRTPQLMGTLTPESWDLLLRQARRARLLPRLAFLAQELNLAQRLPERIPDHLAAARILAEHNSLALRWEANRIARAVVHLDVPVVLLKGAAYLFADLPPARGRLATDIDIMVPKEALDTVQSSLEANGWQEMDLDAYDQQYYRRWMHELPPLRHRERGTVLDLHHTILPRTSRLRPDPRKLWENARKLPDYSFYTLSPEDIVLHSAAHLFHDGDLRVAIRDLVDIGDLFGYFGRNSDFWEHLVPRAREMDLGRPLYYAMRYATKLLGAPIPKWVLNECAKDAPSAVVRAVMDQIVPQVLLPTNPDQPARKAGNAAMALYIRSHWLRMPPFLLTAHLTRKGIKRLSSSKNTT